MHTVSASLLLVLAACTAPPDSESLPASELAVEPVLEFQARPDALPPPPAPPSDPGDQADEGEAEGQGEEMDDDSFYESLYKPGMLVGAAPSGLWAASDRKKVWIGSGTVSEVFTGDFKEGIDQLAVDSQGGVWIVDGEQRLHQAGAGKAPALQGKLPLDAIEAFETQSPWLIVVGVGEQGSQMAFSRDGEHWAQAPGPELGSMATELAVSPGLLQVFTSTESGCGGGFQTRSIATVELGETFDPASLAKLEWKSAEWGFDAPGGGEVVGGGWIFVSLPCKDPETGDDIGPEGWEGLCAIDRHGKQQVLHTFAGGYQLEHGHGQTLLLEDGGLWEVEIGDALKLTRIGDGQPGLLGRVDDATVDGAGHMLLVKGDKLHIGGATPWSELTLVGAQPESNW